MRRNDEITFRMAVIGIAADYIEKLEAALAADDLEKRKQR